MRGASAGEVLDLAHGAAVGQAEKEQVGRFQLARADKLQLGAPAQVGMREVDEVAGVAFAGDLPDHHVRVVQQQAQQFAAGVARWRRQ